jgi:hypothetical protein
MIGGSMFFKWRSCSKCFRCRAPIRRPRFKARGLGIVPAKPVATTSLFTEICGRCDFLSRKARRARKPLNLGDGMKLAKPLSAKQKRYMKLDRERVGLRSRNAGSSRVRALAVS